MKGWHDNLLQLRPYDQKVWQVSQRAQILAALLPSHIIPIWSRSGIFDPEHHSCTTPRWRQINGYFTMASLYYAEYLMHDDMDDIADIGCGENVFSWFYPNIIGYDPFIDGADHKLPFDSVFVNTHQKKFSGVLACNSLHFNGLDQFATDLRQLKSITKPNSLIHVTANTMRSIDAITGNQHGNNSTELCVEIALMIDHFLRGLDLDWVVIDQCYHGIYENDLEFNNAVLGNVRLVFKS